MTAAADEILVAARSETLGFQDRAALLKTFKHLYMVERKGAQTVWVMDPPSAYQRWPYDEFASRRAADIKASLKQDDEVFGPSNREMMAEALQLAHSWCADVQMKLMAPAALKEVHRWFHLPTATPAEVEKTRGVLREGYRKIQQTCNANCVVFSDQADERHSGRGRDGWAAVTIEDRVPVIYIFELFLRAGQRCAMGHVPKLWQCAVTIIHELSHKVLGTADWRYEDHSLKPAKFDQGVPISNAESWAYFAAAMVNALQVATINRVLR